jgi:hypothetical protein
MLFLFLHSYITIVCYIVFIWSIMCFVLGNSVPEPIFEDFQEQVFVESVVFFSGQQGKCP